MEPAGLAVPCSAHEVPFQPAATVRMLLAHTGVHAVAEVHDTPRTGAARRSAGPGSVHRG